MNIEVVEVERASYGRHPRKFQASSDDGRVYRYGAPTLGAAKMMAREWARYTYGREARISVKVRG